MSETYKAVILARGLGTRMQKIDESVRLGPEEVAIAATGLKAMIPIDGHRPFLDYVLGGLAEAGYERVCLVVAPEHGQLRRRYEQLVTRRIGIDFAVQAEPLGTADAVAASGDFAGEDDVLVINSDNYYPLEALRKLRQLGSAGLAAFDREGLLAGSNIPAERIGKFAVVEIADGWMKRIIEKPSPADVEALGQPVCVSMNCWRFTPAIFEACRRVKPSPRGELEITDAVQYAIDVLGERFAAVTISAPVLDLSCRADVGAVKEALKGVEVSL